MIIVKLMGGLGNQMFQYACARALSARHRVPLKLDLSYLNRAWLEKLKGNPQRSYSLGVLRIKESFARPQELPPLTWFPGTRFSHLLRVTAKFLKPSSPLILRETPFDLKANLVRLKNAGPHTYLDGYFQSELYFRDIQRVILREFRPKKQIFTQESQALLKTIQCTASVSLHIRRNDYVSHPAHSSFLGALPSDYYRAAIAFIGQRVKNPHFFIFGDDLVWPRQNLEINHPHTFVKENLNTGHYYEDLFLMSRCRHNIVANSTFAWWGAYLNQSSQKIVIAPKRWFRARSEDGGVVPKEWVRL